MKVRYLEYLDITKEVPALDVNKMTDEVVKLQKELQLLQYVIYTEFKTTSHKSTIVEAKKRLYLESYDNYMSNEGANKSSGDETYHKTYVMIVIQLHKDYFHELIQIAEEHNILTAGLLNKLKHYNNEVKYCEATYGIGGTHYIV